MVATLVRLRFLLLFNTLRRNVWQLIAAILGALYGLGILVLIVAALVGLSFTPLETIRTVIVLAGSATTIGWILIPLLTTGLDQTVDPARLATFPIPRDQLLLAIAVSGVLGVPGIVTSIAALATVVAWWQYPLAMIAAVVGAALGVLTCVIGSRMLGALATRVGTGRRAREARWVLVFIPLILLGPILFGLGQLIAQFQDVLPTIARVLGYTPVGAAWALPGAVAAGEWATAGLVLLIALATLVVFTVVWRWALARALELPPVSTQASPRRAGLGLFGFFPGTVWGAVAARALTYWMRDPRYSQSLISVPLVPALIFFSAGAIDSLGVLLWVGPIIAVLLSMSIYTDISYDNTAFALHLQKGVRGVDDRLGRVVALALFAVPVSLAITVASVAVVGQWDWLVGLIAVTIGVLLSGFAVSSVLSGWTTFPVPVPGESPFKSRPGGGFGLLLSTLVSWTILGALVLPELALAIIGFATGNALFAWLALVVALGIGGAVCVVGIRWGGRIVDARGPQLLVQLQEQK